MRIQVKQNVRSLKAFILKGRLRIIIANIILFIFIAMIHLQLHLFLDKWEESAIHKMIHDQPSTADDMSNLNDGLIHENGIKEDTIFNNDIDSFHQDPNITSTE